MIFCQIKPTKKGVFVLKKTKIICTIGPSCENEDVIEEMIKEGMDTARMNFSHSTYQEHQKRIDIVKKIRKKLNLPIGIMLDTKGPEIRIGVFEKGFVELSYNQHFTLTTEEITGNESIVSVSYKHITNIVKENDTILINDGLIELKAETVTPTHIISRVVHPGKLSDRKSINLPNTDIQMPYLSETDKNDILFGIKNDIDYIAASFVRCKDDVEDIRRLIIDNGKPNIKIIAKIENAQGVKNIDEIILASDGIMIARGDMGVEIPFEKLPSIQKEIIRKCYQSGKISVTATQMLESMITNPRPTRAEVNDIANAIYDGTSAIMLSGETAIGKFPVQTVLTMRKIAEYTENSINYYDKSRNPSVKSLTVTDAISHAVCTCAHDLNARCIVAVTKSGHTPRMIAKFRPVCPIIAPTIDEDIYHKLSLVWGVIPIVNGIKNSTKELYDSAIEKAKEITTLIKGDIIVLTGSSSINVSKTTNMIRVHKV